MKLILPKHKMLTEEGISSQSVTAFKTQSHCHSLFHSSLFLCSQGIQDIELTQKNQLAVDLLNTLLTSASTRRKWNYLKCY